MYKKIMLIEEVKDEKITKLRTGLENDFIPTRMYDLIRGINHNSNTI